MRIRNLVVMVLLLALIAGAVVIFQGARQDSSRLSTDVGSHAEPHASHSPANQTSASRIPAFQTEAEAKDLPPTLPAAQFIGKTRQAYQVAKQIPDTLAQLPCYCECDKAFGHKSLHTCFVDDHASHCAVCVDEALLAYRLEKEQKLTPAQVREKIIEKYSASQ